jgi:folate-dependent phosphoribosylglycinamide formyltransferase PurN
VNVFIVAIDEPIYLNPYVRGVIASSPAVVVGVAVLRPPRRPTSLKRSLSLLMLAWLVFGPARLARLAGLKVLEMLSPILPIATRHRLADICREAGVPVTTIASACGPEFVAELRRLKVDVLIHQTPEILKGDVLRAPTIAVVNRHMAWLPSYRGAWPVFWQFANDERRLGVTIHKVDAGVDTGDIIVRESVERLPSDSIASAYARLFERSVAVTCDALRRLEAGSPLIANGGAGASSYRTPTPAEILRFMLGRSLRSARKAA